jgi:hypothetical protein
MSENKHVVVTKEDKEVGRKYALEAIAKYQKLIEDHSRGGNDGIVECLSKIVAGLQKVLDDCEKRDE